ncbi:leptin receptor isoform 2-T3 [Pholidichthys leucotaenia]
MTTVMVWSVMLMSLMLVLLLSRGLRCSEPEDGASLHPGALDLPWQGELCCDSPSAHLSMEGGNTNVRKPNRPEPNLPHKPSSTFRSSANESHYQESSGVRPSPPANLSHIQTIEAELMLHWDDPSDSDSGPLKYEVRYSSNTTESIWQVLSAAGEPRLSLDLKHRLNYTVQVRCSSLVEPPLWSKWSKPYHIYLNTVTYIPDKVVVRAGENVTMYCIFNDHSINASTAKWIINFDHLLHHSQYHRVNQRVSRITLRPSETRLYDVLQCLQDAIPYSQIYVEGAYIDIKCKTNGNIDAMDCSWNNSLPTKLTFQFRSADLDCAKMEERERAGEEVGELGPARPEFESSEESCTIHRLRTNCYKLWLEDLSRLGPVRSKPIYLSPIDHVKPHPPTNVSAVSWSSKMLMVTWKPPSLPVQGVQCQFRYHLPSTSRGQPEWKVLGPVTVSWAQVAVSKDMCRIYMVQVRCIPTNGKGYWSEWSDSVYSTPQNSKAPERGPDFWRIRQDDPYRNQSNITLLFKHLPESENYCVDGYIVHRQSTSGSVWRERIEVVSSYTFEWNQEVQTVTVEAYNSLGSSTNNINMTLEKKPKGSCVRSFHVLVINSNCVSLLWTLWDGCSAPLFMVVQWLPRRQQPSEDLSGDTWARLPYNTNQPVHQKGKFFDSEEYTFYLYPVFAEWEGEPMLTLATRGDPTATRGDPTAHMMLMILSLLFIILFVTLVLLQIQMKKLMWKDVPNPKKCSWAKGLDFQKVDTFDHLFRPPDGMPAWPLLLPPEDVSKIIMLDKALTTALTYTPLVSPPPEPFPTSLFPQFEPKVEQLMGSDSLPCRGPSFTVNLEALTTLSPTTDELQTVGPSADQQTGSTDSSSQSSVAYATVLLSKLNPAQHPNHLHYVDSSGCSSSDEGNFSANNSDISGSFPCGLWELDSCRGGEMDDPRRSCSLEELSETSETENEEEMRQKKHLYYLGMDNSAVDGGSEEEEEQEREGTKCELLKRSILSREDCSMESQPHLSFEDSAETVATCGLSPLYLPQFRTAPCTRQLVAPKQEHCD